MYNWRKLRERLFAGFAVSISLVALIPIFHLVIVIFVNGVSTLLEAGIGFFTQIPPTPLSREIGGVAPSIIGTLLMTAISLPITVVLGLFTAIVVTEFPRNKFSLIVDTTAKSLASIPTIAVSMIVFSLVVIPMRKLSALSGALALVIIALPYAYTYFSAILRCVPTVYKEAAFSIAMSRWTTVMKIVVGVVKKNIMVGVLMTMARIMGETAALLFTAGRYRTGLPRSILDPVDALPLLIFDYILSPFEIWHKTAWGATLLLLLAYMIVFFAVKLIVKEVVL